MTLKNNPFYIIDYFVEKFMQNNKNDINSKEERKTTPKSLLPNTAVMRSGKYLFQNSTTYEENVT